MLVLSYMVGLVESREEVLSGEFAALVTLNKALFVCGFKTTAAISSRDHQRSLSTNMQMGHGATHVVVVPVAVAAVVVLVFYRDIGFALGVAAAVVVLL